MGKNLLVLAGYRGSGKSTTLSHAHRHKLPLFGGQMLRPFLNSTLPNAKREMDVVFQDAIANRSWLSATHMIELLQLRPKPETVVIHWDFITFIQMTREIQGLKVDDVLMRLKDRSSISALMKIQIQLLSALMEDFEHTAITTLVCPWDELCRRMQSRAYAPKTLSGRLFEPLSDAGQMIHANIYETWFELIQALPCHKQTMQWGQQSVKTDKEFF
jgi:hypothetical protein